MTLSTLNHNDSLFLAHYYVNVTYAVVLVLIVILILLVVLILIVVVVLLVIQILLCSFTASTSCTHF